MKIVGTMFRQPILLAMTFLGFIFLVSNMPIVECGGNNPTSVSGSILTKNSFDVLAENEDENVIPTDEEKAETGTALMSETVESKEKLKMKGIIAENSGEEQKEDTENSEFKINMEDLNLVSLYFYKNPPRAVKRQSDKEKAWKILKDFIVKKYIQRNVTTVEVHKLYVAKKEANKLLNEQIDIILGENVEEKYKKYEGKLLYFVDESLLRYLLGIVERKYGSTANNIQKQKKVFGLYLYHHNLSSRVNNLQNGGRQKFEYKITNEQRYHLNGYIDKIFYEYLENTGKTPVFKNAVNYQRQMSNMMKLPKATMAAENSAEVKESNVDIAFLREKIDHLIARPTNRMKNTPHKLYAMFEIAFGLYLKEKQLMQAMSRKQTEELDQAILKILFEDIEKIDKKELRKLINRKFIQNVDFYESVKKGELQKPMETIFTKYIEDQKNKGKIKTTLQKFQLDSLIYEIFYEYVDPGFGLNFGSHVVKEIEEKLHEDEPYDDTQHYARQNWNWWPATPAVPLVQHGYSAEFFPPLGSSAVQFGAGYFVPPLVSAAQSGYSGSLMLSATQDYTVQNSMSSAVALTYYDYDLDRQIQEQQKKLKEERIKQFNKLRDERGYATVALAGTAIRIGKPSPQSTSTAGQATGPTSHNRFSVLEDLPADEPLVEIESNSIGDRQHQQNTSQSHIETHHDDDHKMKKPIIEKEVEEIAKWSEKKASHDKKNFAAGSSTLAASKGQEDKNAKESVLDPIKNHEFHIPVEAPKKSYLEVLQTPQSNVNIKKERWSDMVEKDEQQEQTGKSNVATAAEHHKNIEQQQMEMGEIIPPKTTGKGILGAKPASIGAKSSAKQGKGKKPQ